jgi:hypothetical protein
MSAGPYVELEWPAARFALGAAWLALVAPEADAGQFELSEDYTFYFPWWWFDGNIENANAWVVADAELEGAATLTLVAYIRGIELALASETQYAPDIAGAITPSVMYEFHLLKGTATVGAAQTLELVDTVEVGETEFPVSYEHDVGDNFALAGEITPTYSAGPGWTLSASLSVEWSPGD